MKNITHDILEFWFGTAENKAQLAPQKFWFSPSPELDAEMKSHFEPYYEQIVASRHNGTLWNADEHLAAVIVLDQIPRNIFRGTTKAFATDQLARGWARRAITAGHDVAQKSVHRRLFFYLPLEHSEELWDQQESVDKITALGNEEYTRYAHLHRDVISEFGRFPHRNDIIGRQSSEAEKEYLSKSGAGF